MGDVQWVNSSSLIAQNPKVTAINSCIEIDLSGQVVSDSIGTRMYSGDYFTNLLCLKEKKYIYMFHVLKMFRIA